jgi:hypothetical protein
LGIKRWLKSSLSRSGVPVGSIQYSVVGFTRAPGSLIQKGLSTGLSGVAEKTSAVARKILKCLIVLLSSETDASIVTELIECCRCLLPELPLVPFSHSLSTHADRKYLMLVDIEVLVSRLFSILFTRALDPRVTPLAISVLPIEDTERLHFLLGKWICQ